MKRRYIILVIVGIFALAISSFIKTTYQSTESMQTPPDDSLNPQSPRVADVVIDSPRSGAQLSFPLRVIGRAKTDWFPSGSFPIYVEDRNGVVIASGTAHAGGYTFTQNYIPFEATVVYTDPYRPAPIGTGYLTLKSAAGGLTDQTKNIPIRF